MLKTSGNREKRQWVSLQAELNWKYCHLDAVKSLKSASSVAKLTEEALRVSVQKMTEEHSFEEGDGWLSVKVVNELVSVWKKLKEKHYSSILWESLLKVHKHVAISTGFYLDIWQQYRTAYESLLIETV